MFQSNQNQQGLNIPCHNIVREHINLVRTALINEIINKGNENQISLYCLNELSYNSYNNQVFLELLKACLDLFAYYQLTNKYYDPNKCFQEAIVNSYLYFLCGQTLEIPNLSQMCNQETLNLCRSNVQSILYELRDFDRVYSNQNVNMFNNQNNIGYNQPQQMFGINQNKQTLPVSNRNFNYEHNRQSNQIPTAPNIIVADNNQFAQQTHFVDNEIKHQITDNDFELTTEHSWEASENQRYKTLVNRRIENERYIINSSGIVLQEILPKQERIMDLEKHRILGGSLTFNTPRTCLNVKDKAEELGKISSNDINQNASNIDNKIENYIWYQQIPGSSIEDIIFEGRLIKEKNQDKTNSVYRCFCLMGKPVIGKPEYMGLFDSLQSNSFEEISNKLKNIANSDFKHFVNDANFKLLCLKIDNYIKNLVNDFIKYGLRLDKLSLDSFTDDIARLENILAEKLGDNYLRAYVEFEKEIVKNLFLDTDISKINFESDNAEGLNILYIPSGFSITYIDLTDKELDIRVMVNSPYKIDNLSNKLLYEIADSLFKQKNGIIYEVITDYLVTADDVVYKLYKSYLEESVYFLIK